jgi:hypothetical protein
LSNRVGVSSIEKFDPKNMWAASGILFLSALELEIHLGKNSTPTLDNQRKCFMVDIRRVNRLVCMTYVETDVTMTSETFSIVVDDKHFKISFTSFSILRYHSKISKQFSP